MTLGSAQSGHAIKRGIQLALDEINQKGGVLGRKMVLLVKDHEGISARGVANFNAFLVAVMGGLHSPVALSELKVIHENRIIYLDPWAAATKIVKNDFHPNYVFRVSVNDEEAGPFLVNHIVKNTVSLHCSLKTPDGDAAISRP